MEKLRRGVKNAFQGNPLTAASSKKPVLFLSANTPWVYSLAQAMAGGGRPTTAVRIYDWRNYRRLRPRWPNGQPPQMLSREQWIFPPGFAGRLSPIAGLYVRLMILNTLRRMRSTPKEKICVVAPYPWLVSGLDGIADIQIIYYNLDNYSLYRPDRSKLIADQEEKLVAKADLILCLSQHQTGYLSDRYPKRANCARHFPLGVVEHYLNQQPGASPQENSVGYIGNLIDRVDWRFVRAVADAAPDFDFYFVGGLEGSGGGGQRANWRLDRALALEAPNVHHIGQVDQSEVAHYYWKYSINWIPYATDHAFNQASCPTKIMDGLASGRPVLSVDLPECKLYPSWVSVVRSVEETVGELRRLSSLANDQVRAQLQIEFARRNSWGRRAELLEEWLDELA